MGSITTGLRVVSVQLTKVRYKVPQSNTCSAYRKPQIIKEDLLFKNGSVKALHGGK